LIEGYIQYFTTQAVTEEEEADVDEDEDEALEDGDDEDDEPVSGCSLN